MKRLWKVISACIVVLLCLAFCETAQAQRPLVERVAARSPNGDLMVVFWSPGADWQVVNVRQKTGQRMMGPATSWQTKDGRFNVEHLAAMSPNGDLLVFFWSPRADWQVVNVSQKTGQRVMGPA